jgi:enoyl-CoA hydratase
MGDRVGDGEPQRLGPGMAVLTMNRPEHLNAMNHDLIAGLHSPLAAVHNDRSCRAVVITGAGRGFSAGPG